jgi:AraC family transcriptional regulator
MLQPPLDHHYVVMHLGGAKRVVRSRDGPQLATVVDCESLTFVAAGTAHVWHTEGPIAFAHLYVAPRQLEEVIARDFDAEGRDATLNEGVGSRDPFLEPLLAKMISELGKQSRASELLLDGLLEGFYSRLAQTHGPRKARRNETAVALAPHRLRRVIEFIDANLCCPLALADLVAAAGSSQSHFSRSFHGATGSSPYSYLLRRRIAYAKVLLLTSDDPLDAIGTSCGFRQQDQFAYMFKRNVGVGPKRFRMIHCKGRARPKEFARDDQLRLRLEQRQRDAERTGND